MHVISLTGAIMAAALNVPVPTAIPSPVVPPVPTVARGYAAPRIRPTNAEVTGITRQPFVEISLSDAIGMALRRNPDIAVSENDSRIAGYQVAAARGGYDVAFHIEPSINHSTTAPLNSLFAGPEFGPIVNNTQSLQAGINGQLATGTQYDVSITQSRIDNNTLVNAFDPYYAATLSATITQPLLRNAGSGNAVRHQLELAVANREAVNAQTLATASTTVSSVENTYWDLLSAWRNVAIQEDALLQAIEQQKSNIRSARAAQTAPIDVVESSTQVSVYQTNVFSALQNVESLQNQLKSLILDNPGDPIWQANLVPSTPPLELEPIPSIAAVLATAMKNRPEIAQAAAAQRQADIDVSYARNQLRPQVDLQLSYTGNGIAGNAIPVSLGPIPLATPPSYLGGALGQAYGNIGRFPTYSAGVVIQTPIGNRTAKADLAVARAQAASAGISAASVDQRILADVRNAVQNYQTALARLYSATAAREASQAVYESELRKFHSGYSTTFLVDQRHVDLVQNQGVELQAQTDLNKALVELERVDGTILTKNHVDFETLGKESTLP